MTIIIITTFYLWPRVQDDNSVQPIVQLSSLQMFACDLTTLLEDAGGRMLLTNFETAYLDRFGELACTIVNCRVPGYYLTDLFSNSLDIIKLVQSLFKMYNIACCMQIVFIIEDFHLKAVL